METQHPISSSTSTTKTGWMENYSDDLFLMNLFPVHQTGLVKSASWNRLKQGSWLHAASLIPQICLWKVRPACTVWAEVWPLTVVEGCTISGQVYSGKVLECSLGMCESLGSIPSIPCARARARARIHTYSTWTWVWKLTKSQRASSGLS